MLKPAIFFVVCVAACSDAPKEDPIVQLLPRGPASGQDSVAAIARSRDVVADSSCVPLSPYRVSLTGILRREVHLGAPGYGESPERDERDTILVLELPQDIPVCPDLTQSKHDSVAHVSRVQLTGDARDGFDALGSRVTAFGALSRAVWPTDFLPVGLRTDSIPALRKPLPRRS